MQDKDIPRLSRLMAILTQLQSKRLLTATEIVKKFKVSIRTVYRDIKALEQAGVPVLTEEGKGYTIMDGYRLPPVMFTEREANAFVTAEKLVLLNSDSSLTQDYKEGVAKIKSVLRANARDKALSREALVARRGLSRPATGEGGLILPTFALPKRLTTASRSRRFRLSAFASQLAPLPNKNAPLSRERRLLPDEDSN
jgi:predicted DNA-binding transcriptional regulator YafY